MHFAVSFSNMDFSKKLFGFITCCTFFAGIRVCSLLGVPVEISESLDLYPPFHEKWAVYLKDTWKKRKGHTLGLQIPVHRFAVYAYTEHTIFERTALLLLEPDSQYRHCTYSVHTHRYTLAYRFEVCIPPSHQVWLPLMKTSIHFHLKFRHWVSADFLVQHIFPPPGLLLESHFSIFSLTTTRYGVRGKQPKK